MKALLLSISAAALLVASPARADQNWTGPYIGAHVGGVWGNASTTDDKADWGNDPKFIGPFDFNPAGAFGGATAGFNLQMGILVAGLEGDLGYMDLSGSIDTPSSQSGNHQTIALDGGLYGTATARLGVLVTPATLIYGKGGFAFYDGEASQATTAEGYETHGTSTFTGWVAGGGIEHRLTDSISVRIEYQHFDFGSQGGDQTSLTDDPIGHVYENSTKLTADSVKLGIAYKF